MMRCTSPHQDWRRRGVDRVVSLEPCDLKNPDIGRIEILGYKIGAVCNYQNTEIIVVELPHNQGSSQIGLPVLDLEDALKGIRLKG